MAEQYILEKFYMAYAALIYLMAVISPGPNFILVSRYSSLGNSRLGFAVSFGICAVSALFAIISLLGLASILSAFPSFTKIIVLLGSCYLTYIAFTIFSSTLQKSSGEGDDDNVFGGINSSWFGSFRVGALTNLFNMKTIAFMVSIFSGFLAVPRSPYEQVMIVLICSALEIIWYLLVAVVFGRPLVRSLFFRYRITIDRGLALFLVLFAAHNLYQVI